MFSPVAGASIYVCSYPANATPCTNLATVYSDQTGLVPITQPILSNAQGSFGFWAGSGNYQYTVTTTQAISYGPYSITVGASSLPVSGTAGQQLTVNSSATSNIWQDKVSVEARDFPGANCGAKINAADAYLTQTYGANIGSIVVDKNCGQTINTTVIINGHGLRFLAGAGTFTSNLSGSSFAIPFRLKSNSSLICDDWSTIIQESSTVGARQTIVDAFNAQAANLHDDNILVQGCHFRGANVAYTGTAQTVELGNCHNCRVVGNFFDAVRGIAVAVGGASGSTYADGVWVTDNFVVNGPTQIFAVVNGQNWHISRNISIRPGDAGGTGVIGSTVDIEPNSNTDKAGPGEITDNIFDFRNATNPGGYPITVTTWDAPAILINNNDLIGGLLNSEAGGPTRNVPSCISVSAHSPSTPSGLRVTNNHCSMTTQAPYNFNGIIGSEIANNLAVCPGGGNGYIRMQAGSQNNNIHNNSFVDPCGTSSSVNENIEEDGASISNNRIWGNLATRATLVGTGSTEAFRVEPTTGLLTADSFVTSGPNGGSVTTTSISENITLSTSGATTDSSANLLPANATINAVGCRVSTTVTTATDWSVGDSTTAARFGAANATMTVGATSNSTGTAWTTGIASATTGIKQAAAAKLRITTTGTPGAGAIRCTVFYSQPTPPTS